MTYQSWLSTNASTPPNKVFGLTCLVDSFEFVRGKSVLVGESADREVAGVEVD